MALRMASAKFRSTLSTESSINCVHKALAHRIHRCTSLLLAFLRVERWALAQYPLIAARQEMHHVFARREPESPSVFLEHLNHRHRQAIQRASVIEDFSNESGCTPKALGTFFEEGSLLWSEAKRLREVIVPTGRSGHQPSSLARAYHKPWANCTILGYTLNSTALARSLPNYCQRPTTRVVSTGAPARESKSLAEVPAGRSRRSCSAAGSPNTRTSAPSIPTTTSPGWIPARSAGWPGRTYTKRST